jgi:tRNA (guanine37-N1)-methyltransferase
MRIDIVTLFPDMFEGPFTTSIFKRAIDAGIAEIHFHNPRDYATDKHKQVDDYQFGGGAGMVLMPGPLGSLLDDLLSQRTYDEVIYVTPDGEQLKQGRVNRLSQLENIIIVCGRYKGIDERIRQKYITLDISIGDYVLTGGELATMILCDAVIRIIPGAMNDGTSALTDSFQDNLLAPPVYTRPSEYNGMKVPDVLMSGNFKLIDDWRNEQALERTKARRPDLLDE